MEGFPTISSWKVQFKWLLCVNISKCLLSFHYWLKWCFCFHAQNGPKKNWKLEFRSDTVCYRCCSRVLRKPEYLCECVIKKVISVTVNQDFQELAGERATCAWPGVRQTWTVGSQECHMFISCCVVCVTCWWLRKWIRTAALASPSTCTESMCYCTRSCIYMVYIQISPALLQKKVSPSSLHWSWCKTMQVGHLKSHYVVCTDCHIVRLAGVYKILWP